MVAQHLPLSRGPFPPCWGTACCASAMLTAPSPSQDTHCTCWSSMVRLSLLRSRRAGACPFLLTRTGSLKIISGYLLNEWIHLSSEISKENWEGITEHENGVCPPCLLSDVCRKTLQWMWREGSAEAPGGGLGRKSTTKFVTMEGSERL